MSGTDKLAGTVDDLISLAFALMKKRRKSKNQVMPYECAVTKARTRWYAQSFVISMSFATHGGEQRHKRQEPQWGRISI